MTARCSDSEPMRTWSHERLLGRPTAEDSLLGRRRHVQDSPDYNPIEEAFAKVKNLIRNAAARTKETLVEAIGVALCAVSALDARGFFEHAGYRSPAHLL